MMIKDLKMSKELDRKALSVIRGGYHAAAEQFCGTPWSSPVPAIEPPLFALPSIPEFDPGLEVIQYPALEA